MEWPITSYNLNASWCPCWFKILSNGDQALLLHLQLGQRTCLGLGEGRDATIPKSFVQSFVQKIGASIPGDFLTDWILRSSLDEPAQLCPSEVDAASSGLFPLVWTWPEMRSRAHQVKISKNECLPGGLDDTRIWMYQAFGSRHVTEQNCTHYCYWFPRVSICSPGESG